MFMTYVPIVLLTVLLALFVWNKWRYDVVAVFGLVVAVIIGIVPANKAFEGFAHPAVILVAAALIISRTLQLSGALHAVLGFLPVKGKPLWAQLLIVCSATMFLSAFINNVAAVALMIPFVISLAYQSKTSARLYLMPIAFSSILGGMITLIGTPPNIIIATFRAQAGKAPAFSMFDFTPVGITLALVGLVIICFAARRLIPAKAVVESTSLMAGLREYLTDLLVSPESPMIGTTIREFIEKYPEVVILGVRRSEKTYLVPAPYEKLQAEDVLIIEAPSDNIGILVSDEKFVIQANISTNEKNNVEEMMIVELIVPSSSASLGRSSKQLDIRWKYGVNVLGVARSGHRMSRHLADVIFTVGDIVLVQGSGERITQIVEDMGWVFISEQPKVEIRKKNVILPIVLFASAILASYLGFLNITIAFVGCALIYVVLGLLRPNEVYDAVEWPVIVLLACLIPIGVAMETSGSLQLIANLIGGLGKSLGPVSVLAILMLVTIFLTNIVNNAAAAIVMAPVGLRLAEQLQVSPDTMLMAVAIASSTAFITPIAHQSNTLVLEPGEYKFQEYAYLGLPLTIFVFIVSIPMLLLFWPL